jgi:6,7-dimethyl-8-ribityllumazine synthase
MEALAKHGVDEKRVHVVWVPGAFEIPLACRTLVGREPYTTGDYAAVVALGAVIRGATPHFDAIARVVASGVARASYESGVPVIFGVLTTDTIAQAWERAGRGGGNKGYDAALAALEMVHALRTVADLRATHLGLR